MLGRSLILNGVWCQPRSESYRVMDGRARRSRPIQTGPDDDHGRQCQEDISRECKLNPSQQVSPNRHHGAEDWDADSDRHPLARGHETGGEPPDPSAFNSLFSFEVISVKSFRYLLIRQIRAFRAFWPCRNCATDCVPVTSGLPAAGGFITGQVLHVNGGDATF